MIKRYLNNHLRIFFLVFLMLNSGYVLADKISVQSTGGSPIYAVTNNNAVYTEVFGGIADFEYAFQIDAGSVGGVKTYTVVTGATAYDTQGMELLQFEFYNYTNPEYLGIGPDSVSKNSSYRPTADELVAACNAQADKMRQNGHTNQSIFNQDRTVKITATISVSANFTLSTFDVAPVYLSSNATLTCRKFTGLNPDLPQLEPKLKLTPGVTAVNLQLQEMATLGGSCKVGLSGEIETNVPNLKVRYRFEHHDGKQSDIKELTTGTDKKGSFNFQYDIPNGPGPEGGSIKLIGVDQDFESNSESYSMDCREPGPGSLKENPEPKVTVDELAISYAVSQASIKLNKRHFVGQCPMTVYATGSITTNAKGDVIYRVWHNGKAGPQKKLTMSNAGNQVFTYPLVLRELGATPVYPSSGAVGGSQTETVGGLATETVGGSGQSTGSGGLTANHGTNPVGNVRLQILSPKTGVKHSKAAIYTLNCKTPLTPLTNKFGAKQPTTTPGKTLTPSGKKPTTGLPKVKSGQKKNLINNKWYRLRSMSPEGKDKYTHLRINGQRVELKDKKNNIVKAPDGHYTLHNGYQLTMKRGQLR